MVAPSSSTTAAALAVANTSCATCRQPLLRRYEGTASYSRPLCDSSKTTDSIRDAQVYLPEYIASRADKSRCMPSHQTQLPRPPIKLGKHEFAWLVRDGGLSDDHDHDSQGMVNKPAWHAYLCLSCYAFNQRTNWSYFGVSSVPHHPTNPTARH